MRKYYYYTYRDYCSIGCDVIYSDNGEFDLFEAVSNLRLKHGFDFIIDNWKEISSTQYEKLKEYFDNQNK